MSTMISEVYEAFRAANVPDQKARAAAEAVANLEPLPIQYADYTVWQHNSLQGETLEKLIAYWQQQLAGSGFVLDLPTDRPRPPIQNGKGQVCPAEQN